MSYQVSLGQSLKNMMQSFQDRLGNQKSIFTNDKSILINDISLILDRGTMIGYIWSHAPPCYSSYRLWLGALTKNLLSEREMSFFSMVL